MNKTLDKLLLWGGALGALCLLAAIIVPNFIRPRAQGRSLGCKSCLKNIGSALEMYASDFGGHYPRNLNQLTPNYLKTIPECPSAGGNHYYYEMENQGKPVIYNTGGFKDYYFVNCTSPAHLGISVPEGYPQYDGIQGLIER